MTSLATKNNKFVLQQSQDQVEIDIDYKVDETFLPIKEELLTLPLQIPYLFFVDGSPNSNAIKYIKIGQKIKWDSYYIPSKYPSNKPHGAGEGIVVENTVGIPDGGNYILFEGKHIEQHFGDNRVSPYQFGHTGIKDTNVVEKTKSKEIMSALFSSSKYISIPDGDFFTKVSVDSTDDIDIKFNKNGWLHQDTNLDAVLTFTGSGKLDIYFPKIQCDGSGYINDSGTLPGVGIRIIGKSTNIHNPNILYAVGSGIRFTDTPYMNVYEPKIVGPHENGSTLLPGHQNNTAIQGTSHSVPVKLSVTNPSFSKCAIGMTSGGVDTVSIRGGNISDIIGQHALYLEPKNSGKVEGVTFDSVEIASVKFQISQGNHPTDNVESISVSNCQTTNGKGVAYIAERASGASTTAMFDQVVFSNLVSEGAGVVTIGEAKFATVSNCDNTDSSNYGIHVHDSEVATVLGGTISKCQWAGVTLNNVDHGVVLGTTVFDGGLAASDSDISKGSYFHAGPGKIIFRNCNSVKDQSTAIYSIGCFSGATIGIDGGNHDPSLNWRSSNDPIYLECNDIGPRYEGYKADNPIKGKGHKESHSNSRPTSSNTSTRQNVGDIAWNTNFTGLNSSPVGWINKLLSGVNGGGEWEEFYWLNAQNNLELTTLESSSFEAIVNKNLNTLYHVLPNRKKSSTEFAPTPERTNSTGSFGYEFSLSENFDVHALGRVIGPTFNDNHTISIWRVSDQVELVSAIITPDTKQLDNYSIKELDIPFTLVSSEGPFRISSTEDDGGDTWTSLGPYTTTIPFNLIRATHTTASQGYPSSNSTSSHAWAMPMIYGELELKGGLYYGESLLSLSSTETDTNPIWLVNALNDPSDLDTKSSPSVRVWDIVADIKYIRNQADDGWDTTTEDFILPSVNSYVYLGTVTESDAATFLGSKGAANKFLFADTGV